MTKAWPSRGKRQLTYRKKRPFKEEFRYVYGTNRIYYMSEMRKS